jgi:subfamily B ATP-binding cassette protein MsbA
MKPQTDGYRILIRSLSYLTKYWPLQLACLGVAIVLAVLSLVQPWINKLLIDNVLLEGNRRILGLVCLLYLVAYISKIGFNMLLSYLYSRVGGAAVYDLRVTLYEHLQSLPLSFFNKKKTGDLIASFTSDLQKMRRLFTSTIVKLTTDTLRLFALLTAMFLIDSKLTLIAILSLPFYGYFMNKLGRPIRGKSREVQERTAAVTAHLQEKITGMREIKAFSMETEHQREMSNSFGDLFKSEVKLVISGTMGNIVNLVSALGFVLVLWFGGQRVISGAMKTGVFIAFIGYMGRLYRPIGTFVSLNTNVRTSIAAAKRIFTLFDEKRRIDVPDDAAKLHKIHNAIEFENVSFSYPGDRSDQRALNHFSLKIDMGMKLALVGESGSGKTTVAMLLLRFYDPSSGIIRVNDEDIRKYDLRSYRDRIGVVFQDPFLFDSTIRANISFGSPNASQEDILRAAEAAYALEFIDNLPAGIDSVIGERGVSLSGGQQQRLAIARVMLRNPDLVILDEATSALDSRAERYVQKALRHLFNERTSVVIAHRQSTIVDADSIVVMQRGNIIEQGNYKELMRRRGAFWGMSDFITHR